MEVAMKKNLITLLTLVVFLLPSVGFTTNNSAFSKTLQAKLAYYQGFHQHSYDLLSQLTQNDPSFNLWTMYLKTALLSEQSAQALKVASNNYKYLSEESRVYYYTLALLEKQTPKISPFDHHLKWEEVFSLISIEQQATFLSRFYESDLMQLQSARAFMLKMLKLLEYQQHAHALLNKPIAQIDHAYIQQIVPLFTGKELGQYLEKILADKIPLSDKSLFALLSSSQRDYKFSKEKMLILNKRVENVISYQSLSQNEQ
jgi:hypothetical protein